MKPTLEILFGPIASGKSTYAASRAKEGCLVANDDSISMSVHGGIYSSYRPEFKPLYKSIRSQIIHMGAAMGRNVIVDSTGLKRETRDHLRTLARSLGMRVGIVVFRGGMFKGAVDGIRRSEADPRGISSQQWIKIGEYHRDTVDKITAEETELLDFIEYSTWGW